jgi:hypothetical protein
MKAKSSQLSPACRIFVRGGNWQLAGREVLQKVAMNPLQFWMQFAAQWQKAWADTMTFWGKAGKLH